MSLKFTQDTPLEEGFYWRHEKDDSGFDLMIVDVVQIVNRSDNGKKGVFWIDAYGAARALWPKDENEWWARPIPQPKLPKG